MDQRKHGELITMDTQYGQSDFYFGGADLSAAKGRGKNPLQILEYLNNNMDRLRGGNLPGGKHGSTPGLYDQVVSEAAAFEEQERQRQAEIKRAQSMDSMQHHFDRQMSVFQQQMLEQQKSYQAELSEMRNTLQATMNPNTRESPLGIRSAKSNEAAATMNRQGMKGSFGRKGLRIKSLNI